MNAFLKISLARSQNEQKESLEEAILRMALNSYFCHLGENYGEKF